MGRDIKRSLRRAARLLPLLAVAASAPAAARPPIATPGWRTIATEGDRARLRGWRGSWMQGLRRAAAAGKASEVAAHGMLLQPDGALARPAPPPGDYRCRTTKLGSRQSGMPDFVSYPPFACRIGQEGDVLSFAKLEGSQRPVGLLFPDDGTRLIFLGTMMLGDERMAQQYGRDPERDMIGLVERVGPQRWRLVLPAPRWESLIDVIELVPAAG